MSSSLYQNLRAASLRTEAALRAGEREEEPQSLTWIGVDRANEKRPVGRRSGRALAPARAQRPAAARRSSSK
ncbi:MAG: hypothetical protein AW09_000114 [Candidatus Accumulibacter phosphatis]|uniref:Uncharacterized protein n=1 Tax=Candidatus Accumulibacter phosphatis TaxID=327160 RepID=A0A080M2N3_9PROT|nr:MAG: hypothetical protein AW09_000114 [Candidatus Accumulibacter phosphatis]